MDEYLKYIWGLIIAGMAYFTKKTLTKVDETASGLERHKLHVSENYAKDSSVQASLARIHERLDELINMLLETKTKKK